MKLAEAVARASRRELERLALACRLPMPLPSAEEIARRLADPERVHRTVAGLGPVEQLALRVVWIGFNGEAGGEADAHLNRSTGHSDAEKAFRALADLGLLLPSSATPGRHVVPDEIRPLLERWLLDELQRAATAPKPPSAALPGPEPAAAVADLTRLLGRLAGGVSVAGAGHIYKREQQMLLGWLSPHPGNPPPWPWGTPDPAYGPAEGRAGFFASEEAWSGFEPRLGLLLSLAARFELIIEEHTAGPGNKSTRWIASGAAAPWCALDPWTQWWAMFQAWLHLLERIHPALVRLVVAAAEGGCLLQERAAGWWGTYTPGGAGPLRSMAIPFLIHTGWTLGALQVGGGGEQAFIACTPAARAALRPPGSSPADWPAWDDRFYVQADFELIAPPYVHPKLLRRLVAVAEPVRVDRATVLRLSAGRVGGAVLGGDSADAIVAFLETGAAAGVPQNVAFTLREWCGYHRRLALEPALLLRLDDAAVADRLRSVAAIRRLVREEMTPSVWRFDPAVGPRLWDLLREAGFEPRGDPADVQALSEGRERPAGPRRHRVNLPWPGPDAYTTRFSLPKDTPRDVERGRAEAAAAVDPDAVLPASESEILGDWRPSPPFQGLPDVPDLPRRGVRRLVERAVDGGRALLLRTAAGDVAQFDPFGCDGDQVIGYCHGCRKVHELPFEEIRGARLTSLKFDLPDDL